MSSPSFVPVHKSSFAFCRYSLAVLSWSALLLQSRLLVVIAAAIMLLSSILTVQRAPLVVLWNLTIEKLHPSRLEFLDIAALRFAHTFGFALFMIDTLLLSFHLTRSAGWALLAIISCAKTIGALGFCAPSKMYSCATNNHGNCCSFWRRNKRAV